MKNWFKSPAFAVSFSYLFTGLILILLSNILLQNSLAFQGQAIQLRIYVEFFLLFITSALLFYVIKHFTHNKKGKEQHYIDIFQTAEEGIFRSSIDGKFIIVNPAMAKIYGYSSPEEMISAISDISTQIHINESSRKQFVEALKKDGIVLRFEAQNLKKDKTLIWTSTNAHEVRDHKGVLQYYEGFITDITKQKNAEIALHKAESLYRTLFEQMPAAAYTDSPDSFANFFTGPQILSISSYGAEEWRDDPDLWMKIIHPEDKSRVMEENQRTLTNGETFNIEYRIITREGKEAWIHDIASLIKDENGNPIYWQGLLIDITSQKSAETYRQLSDAQYQMLMEQASDGFVVTDLYGKIIEVNEQLCLMLKYKREEILSLSLKDIISKEDLALRPLRFHEYSAGKIIVNERAFLQKNGSLLTVELSTKILPNGKSLSIVRDISSRRLYQETLVRSEQRLRALIENSMDAIALYAPDGKILFQSPAATRILGYSLEELIGRNIYEFIAEEDKDLIKSGIQKLISRNSGEIQIVEVRCIHKDGSIRWLEVIGTNRLGELGIDAIVANYRDISERKKNEETLQHTEKRYRLLVEQLPAVVFMDVFDHPQDTQYISPKLTDLLGYTPTEWAEGNHLWEDSLHPQDKERVLAEDKRTDETGDPFRIEYRLRHKDGHYVWIKEDASIILGDDGKPMFWQGVLLDISEQKKAEEDLQRRDEILKAVGFASEQFLKNSNWKNNINQVLFRLGKATEVSRILVFAKKISKDDDILVQQEFGWYESENASLIGASSVGDTNLTQDGLQRWVDLFNSEITIFGDISDFPETEQSFLVNQDIQSVLCIPIKVSNDWWGYIRFDECRYSRIWSNAEVDALRAAASTLSAAIQRESSEETLQKRLKELDILHTVASAEVQAKNIDELLELVTTIIYEKISPDNCGILLLDEKKKSLSPHPSYRGKNLRNLYIEIPLENGVCGQVAITKMPLRIGDVSKNNFYIQSANDIKSELAMPIIIEEKVVGVLNLESKEIDAFNETDEKLISTISGGLANAIQRLQLFIIEEKRHKQAEILREATALLTKSLDLQTIYQIILEGSSKLVKFNSASIEMINGTYVEIVAEHGLPAGYSYVGTTYPLNHEWDFDIWKPTLIPNVQEYKGFTKIKGTEYIRGWMGIPLIAQEKVIGFLNFDSTEENFFTEDDAASLQTFANQAAVTIENALLFEQESRRAKIIETMADIANETATNHDIEPILDKIAKRTLELLKANNIAIYLLQDDNSTIKIVTAHGTHSNELLSHTIKLGKGITGHLIAEGKPEIINNTSNDPRKITVPGTNVDDGLNETMMSAPLIVRGRCIGAINAWRLITQGYYNSMELNFLVSIAHQASIAIESSRLLQETIRNSQETSAIAEVGKNISSTLDLDIVLERIAAYAKNLLNADTSAIYLADSNNMTLTAIASIGQDAEEIKSDPVTLGQGIVGNIAQQGFGEIVNNTAEDPRGIAVKGTNQFDNEHIMGVPIKSKELLTGLLVVWRIKKDGEFKPSDLNFLSHLAQQAAIAIENARLFEAEQRQRQEAETLGKASSALANLLDLPFLQNAILEWLYQITPYDSATILQVEGNHLRIAAQKNLPNAENVINQIFPADNILCTTMKETGQPLVIDDCRTDPRYEGWGEAKHVRGWIGAPLIARGQVVGYITIDSKTPSAFTKNDAMRAFTFAHQVASLMENTRLYSETRQRLDELELVSRVSTALRAARDTKEMFPILLTEILKSVGTDSVAIWLYEKDTKELTSKAASGWLKELQKTSFKVNEDIIGNVYTSGNVHITYDFLNDPMVSNEDIRTLGTNWGGITVPIRTASEVIGVIMIALQKPHQVESHHTRLITTIAEIAGNAIYRSNLYEQGEEQIRRLTTLREVDASITASLDLQTTLGILTEHITSKMNASAAAILVFNSDSQMFNYLSTSGFNDYKSMHKSLGLGEVIAGEAILNRKDLYIKDLNSELDKSSTALIENEKFTSYYAIPLFSKGALKGVLETFFRAPFTPFPDWLDFLRTLAGQATIAIDNSQLFENLQQSNQELSLAYDTTLEGWGKALELRDKETEGHTRRVTDLTLKLARQMGMSETELINIRRGVLLHDIGKMGVPDNILRKEGPLTNEELIEMRKHPQYAYDLLYPITYLRPAIDIAYSHHEWWNGEGYPQQLKGEDIPLPARIFTVVDVWDALLSNRPYRKAWSRKKVIQYINNLSGKQFDPYIVKEFLKLIDAKEKKVKLPTKSKKKSPKSLNKKRQQ
ncbi:MAG: GAF domain-containing protein [Anaerolineales bacterium]